MFNANASFSDVNVIGQSMIVLSIMRLVLAGACHKSLSNVSYIYNMKYVVF